MGRTAKDLVKALFGKQENIFGNETLKVYSLEYMVKELLGLSDRDWFLYAFSREPLERKFSLEEKYELGYLAMACGESEAVVIRERLKLKNIRIILAEMGFKLNTPNLPNGGENVTFAQFEESGEITVFMDTVKKAEPILEELKIMPGKADIFEILLLHELFHGIELYKSNTIFTQTKKIELWKKPFSNKSKIACLSEIAAMSFAKAVLNLKYNPYIFDVILMYIYNKEAASMLFDEIMEIKENENADNNIKIS